jgi:hypothetical protein
LFSAGSQSCSSRLREKFVGEEKTNVNNLKTLKKALDKRKKMWYND